MRRRWAVWGLVVVLAVAGAVALRPGAGYAAQDREAGLAEASRGHVAGTDELGRDRAVRVAVALLLGLAGAGAAAVLTTGIAAGVGTVAAFSPARVGAAMMLGSDALLTLPWLFLLMMVRGGLPLTTSPLASAGVTFLLLALLGWPACARAVYRGALGLRGSEWMLYGRASGLRGGRVIWRHLLPNLRTLLLPQFLVSVPVFIVAEANLGTLGLGVAEPLPSWGGLLRELDNSALLAQTHWVYLPIALLVTVLLLLEACAAER